MTPYAVAKREELEAANAIGEAMQLPSRTTEERETRINAVRLATEWHLRAVTRRIVAELDQDRRSA